MATAVLNDAKPASPYLRSLRTPLRRSDQPLKEFSSGTLAIEVKKSPDAIFAVVRRPGKGDVAARAAFVTGVFNCSVVRTSRTGGLRSSRCLDLRYARIPPRRGYTVPTVLRSFRACHGAHWRKSSDGNARPR